VTTKCSYQPQSTLYFYTVRSIIFIFIFLLIYYFLQSKLNGSHFTLKTVAKSRLAMEIETDNVTCRYKHWSDWRECLLSFHRVLFNQLQPALKNAYFLYNHCQFVTNLIIEGAGNFCVGVGLWGLVSRVKTLEGTKGPEQGPSVEQWWALRALDWLKCRINMT